MPEFPLVPASRFARMADELAERGWSVQEQLLPEPLAQALERDCRALWQQDDLTPAAIGRGDGQLVMPGKVEDNNKPAAKQTGTKKKV